ncbi:MAG: hypothetical protein ACKOGH_08910 [Alphaproteobacteria bacterium]
MYVSSLASSAISRARRVAIAIAVAALALPLAPPPPRAQAQAPSPGASFEAVRAQLQLGGPFFVYVDFEDQFAKLGRDLTQAVADVVGDDPDLRAYRQDFAGILEELGISGVRAVGMSSTLRRDGSYHNRSFLHAPGPRRGVLAAMGGPARPFSTTRLAPADTDFFLEAEIDMPALVAAITSVARRFDPKADLDLATGAIAAETGMDVGDVVKAIAELRGRVTLALRLGETAMPDASRLEEWGLGLAQKGSFLLRVEGIAPKVLPLLGGIPDLVPATIAGRKAFRSSETVPILGENQPVLVVDGDALLLASSAAFAQQSLERASGLAQAPAFRDALAELGVDQGNSLAYATPRLYRVLRTLLGAAMEAGSGLGGRDEVAGPVAQAILGRLPDMASPMLQVAANLPDGILVRAHGPSSLKSSLLALGIYNPELVGPLALALVPAAIKTVADKASEGRAAEIAQANLQAIGEAALEWFASNPGAREVTYPDIAKALEGRLRRVRDVDFTDFALERGFSKIELELPSGETVAWYAPITEADRERIRENLRGFDRAAAWYFRKYPRETVMLGVEAVEDGSPMASLPDPVRDERYEDLQVRRTDTTIEIEVGAETIAVRRDPALQRQQPQQQRRQPPRGG